MRSGHTSVMCENNIIIFGGIHGVTKEMNDVHAFCIPQRRWINLCEQISGGSPIKRFSSLLDRGMTMKDDGTPPPVEQTQMKENTNSELVSSIKKARGKSATQNRTSSAMRSAARRRATPNKEAASNRQN